MPRPRSFDETELLDAAVELFWVNGYHNVSLTDISDRTGVANGSLYAAFGSKWGLFLAAFRRYCAHRAEAVAFAVRGGNGSVHSVVHRYFEAIIRDCVEQPDQRGCLMLNAIAELGTNTDVSAIASETIDRMHEHVAQALAEAAGREPDDATVRISAVHIVSLSQAMIHLSRLGPAKVDPRDVGDRAAFAAQQALAA